VSVSLELPEAAAGSPSRNPASAIRAATDARGSRAAHDGVGLPESVHEYGGS
jgi:hypothetical protein